MTEGENIIQKEKKKCSCVHKVMCQIIVRFFSSPPPSFFLLLPLCLFHEGKMVMKLVTMSSDCVGFILGHGLRELLIMAFILGRSEESVNFLQFCPQKPSLQGSCYFYYLGVAHRPSKVVRGAKRRLVALCHQTPTLLLCKDVVPTVCPVGDTLDLLSAETSSDPQRLVHS